MVVGVVVEVVVVVFVVVVVVVVRGVMVLGASPESEESGKSVHVVRSGHRYESRLVLSVYLRVVLRVCLREQGHTVEPIGLLVLP